MNPTPNCDEVQVLVSEVALGIASGDERALVLAHAKSCSDCRRMMEELSATADALLLLGPLHEPTSGFESSVLARMQSKRRGPARMRSKLLAAVLATAVVTGAAGVWVTSDDRKVAAYYREALAEANGKYFTAVPLRAASGDRAGHMFAYEGHPPWVFLIFAAPLEPGRYEAELETSGGAMRSLGTFEIIDEGDMTWGRDLPIGLRDVQAMRVLDDQGAVALWSRLPSQ